MFSCAWCGRNETYTVPELIAKVGRDRNLYTINAEVLDCPDKRKRREGHSCLVTISRILERPCGGTAMSGWSRVLAAVAGVVMVVGGLLVLGGHRWGWLLGIAACGAGAFVVSGSLRARRRSDRSP
jgi:hypothetical protein